MSRKLKIIVEVHEYTDKFWPLHQHIGDAEYKGKKIQYDMSLPAYDLFLVIDGTPWTVDNGQIIRKIVDQLEGQNSSEPEMRVNIPNPKYKTGDELTIPETESKWMGKFEGRTGIITVIDGQMIVSEDNRTLNQFATWRYIVKFDDGTHCTIYESQLDRTQLKKEPSDG